MSAFPRPFSFARSNCSTFAFAILGGEDGWVCPVWTLKEIEVLLSCLFCYLQNFCTLRWERSIGFYLAVTFLVVRGYEMPLMSSSFKGCFLLTSKQAAMEVQQRRRNSAVKKQEVVAIDEVNYVIMWLTLFTSYLLSLRRQFIIESFLSVEV